MEKTLENEMDTGIIHNSSWGLGVWAWVLRGWGSGFGSLDCWA